MSQAIAAWGSVVLRFLTPWLEKTAPWSGLRYRPTASEVVNWQVPYSWPAHPSPGTTPNFLNTSEFAFSRVGITGSKYFKLALTIRIYSFLNTCSSVYTKNGNPKSIEYTQRKNA